MIIRESQLADIFPMASKEKIKEYTAAFNQTFGSYGLSTPKRIAAFLGQIGVESGQLRFDEELPSKWNKANPDDPLEPVGSLYEGRKATLGNYVQGDGAKFIGRGIIQLTGRANYALYGGKIGVDLIKNPERAKEPLLATKIALQYWKDRGCNAQADAWRIDKITEAINGKAKLHYERRLKYSQTALRVLQGEKA